MPKNKRKTADRQSSQRRHSPPSVSGGPNVLTRSQRRRQQEAEGPPQLYEPFVANQVPKNKRKTAEQCSQRRHPPYPTSSASGRTGVLTRSQRRRQQETEGQPQLCEPFVANTTASVGNEGLSAVFEEPMAIGLENGPPQSYESFVANPTASVGNEGSSVVFEPMAIDLENVRAVVLESSTSTGPGETTGKEPAATTHEVPGDIQPVPTVGNTQDAHMDPIPGPANIAIDAIGPVDTAVTQLDAIHTAYRQTLSTFSTVINGITRIHPHAQMALSALNRVSKLILSQASLDASIVGLVTTIERTYEVILENRPSSNINATKDVLVEIAQVVQECAQFITKYSESKAFWSCLGKSVPSETTAKVANYNRKLDKLMQELRDRPIPDIQYGIKQIYQDLSSTCLVCEDRAGLNEAKKCLDGTRIEILNELVDWINNTDAATPRIFWLYGQAGKGKSAIAHTIALHARNLGMLGSCFCFSRVRQHAQLHTKLFPTIARDLADRDLRLRPLLGEVTTNNPSLRDTADVTAQWKKLILEPLSHLKGSLTGNVVVVIDALDESGAQHTRATVLKILAACGGELPANIRILLTSRPLVDIEEALDTSPHIYARSLDDIDMELTMRDIYLYVSTRLKSLRDTFSDENLQQLAAKSSGVFEWARLACDFVSPRIGVISKDRFHEIMSHAPGDGRTLLDEMYTTFLKDLLRGSGERWVFRSVMRQILWLKEPLPISALDFMRDRFPREDDRYPVGLILNFMASLLAGANDVSTPVRPLHASFYDFLLEEKRSGEFFIQEGDTHRDLAVASLSAMQAGLHFNICRLETSYISNSEVTDLGKRVEENIPPHLLYSCQFWASHLEGAAFDPDLAQLVRGFAIGEQMLFWLEALGVSKLIGKAYWALISTEGWLQQRKMEYEELLMFIKDGIKFVQNFAGIIDKSTPHLYLSALPFSPSTSILARSLIDKFPGIAQVAVGQQNDWPRNQQVLQGHTLQVNSVAFSPDGRYIVSGSEDRTIQLWDAQTGGQVGNPLQGHTDCNGLVFFFFFFFLSNL
ncbi:hypothetical protein SCLCIDRAFT_1223218 [Scleroderma citrinum Foug A]|uniref:Nephrocystin 3-like N-terminal domain-containing protein n=1 Tax=Scleroderma citrinum Foug A TaxID=1036808 RepID=A0A0C2ZK46_9AGAM|nr:hypothetical protein SCLCIDRAFT_1223218 [Scleroderma citrinum Foug A]